MVKHMKNALLNWGCGWWHVKAFFKNIKVIIKNWKEPISVPETRRILVHNLVCYKQANNISKMQRTAWQAMDYAEDRLKYKLKKFIKSTDHNSNSLSDWKVTNLRLVQLVMPLLLILLFLMPLSSKYVSEAELWKWFSDNKEIKYYQEVKFITGERGVDDVVVGKVLSIPVDKKDVSRLYHLQKHDKVMYGPGEDFDVLKELDARTTVRLTGVTPDNVWSRIMIDNGEMGFVRTENITSGIGKEIPYGSQIFQR